MLRVAILIFGVNLVCAELHSLQYFYTGTSGMANFPQFVAVGMLDGKQIDYYDSVIGKNVLKQAWMEGTRDENVITDTRRGHQATFSNNIKVAMERFNQTFGVHSFQIMYGCELDDDGTKRGYTQFGYDGGDFISFDKNTVTYIAAHPQAVISVNKWNANRAIGEQRKAYLENTCIEWLQKYVDYGRRTLERKVSPQVSLLQKDPSSPVSCHATGFHPKEVTISWQKNTQDLDEDVNLGELIINEDGTFQKTSTLNVKPEEWKKNKYECVVEHQSKTIREILTEDKIKTNYGDVAPFPIGIIVGVVVVLLLVIIGVAGFMLYKKKKGFKPVASDDGSNSSTHSNQKA